MNATDVVTAFHLPANLDDINLHVNIDRIRNTSVIFVKRASAVLMDWRIIWTQSIWRSMSLSATFVTRNSLAHITSRTTYMMCILMRGHIHATSATSDANRKVISPFIYALTPHRRCTSASSVGSSSMIILACRVIFQFILVTTSTTAPCVSTRQVLLQT